MYFISYILRITIVSTLLNGLNEAQQAAVVNFDSPSLIIAGAGSGKTRVLTSRIAYMLEKGVEPHRILALTFTNKAAREMRERIGKMISSTDSYRLWMGTFHSIFLKILRTEAEHLGYPSSFTIYDTSNSKNLIKTIIKEMNLSDEHYKPNTIYSRISLSKNNLITSSAYEANSGCIAEDREKRIPEFVQIYKAYTRRCKDNGAMDFDDMLLNINILFRDFPQVLEKYQRMFSHILVDEYQDTNYAQYIIVRRLAQLHSRVCVVGDDAQSIYSFRGAKIENILRFRNDFPTSKTFKLEQNYRSTQNIVNAANSVIEKNKNRLKKESFSAEDPGDLIKVYRTYTDREEASVVADAIKQHVRDGAEWQDVAILYRTNMQFRAFEDAFRKKAIPYKIYGGTSFYQRKEVKDLLAYFQLIVNKKDDEAFKRIINFPTRGIGNVTLSRISEAAQAKNLSYIEAIETLDPNELGLKGATAVKVKDFAKMISDFALLRGEANLFQFGLEVATRSGIIGSLKLVQSPENQSALDNIEELLNTLQLFEEQFAEESKYDTQTGERIEGGDMKASVEEWLQSAMLITDMDQGNEEDNNKVTLMTVHASKGLEYNHVFIVGLEENLFPSMMSLDGKDGIEEERRLFYVAITRAKKTATLSFSQTRFRWGKTEFCTPSRFISEIDPKYLDIDFPLDDDAPNEGPMEKMKRKWGESNNASSKDTVRGDAANKWHSPNPAQRGSFQPKKVNTTPSIELGQRFKSVEKRVVDIDTGATPPPSSTQSSGGYTVGMRVEHSKFGKGEILEIEHTSSDLKIKVNFDNFGTRALLSKFAKLNIL